MTSLFAALKARRKWLLRLGLGLFVLGVLVTRGDVYKLRDALRAVPWYVPLLSVLFYWLTQCLSAAKWRLLLRARGAQFSFVECARLYLLGMFWNLWMPTTIGGDAMRAIAAAPRCGGVPAALSSILVERLTGLAALLTIGVTGIALWGSETSTLGPAVLPRVIGVLVGVGAAFCALRAAIYRLEPSARRFARAISKAASVFRELDFYARRESRSALVMAFLVSLLFQGAQVALQIFLARAVGLHTANAVFLWLVPLLALISMVPIGIGGLGVREVAAVSVLGHAEPAAIIVAWSLLWQVTTWLSSLPGALLAVNFNSPSEFDSSNSVVTS